MEFVRRNWKVVAVVAAILIVYAFLSKKSDDSDVTVTVGEIKIIPTG